MYSWTLGTKDSGCNNANKVIECYRGGLTVPVTVNNLYF